ncbi:recombination mediator RecR [Haploplasma axanthum]|uniref:Recombination protein RecR n=1 Tax=Haploplasma axanthum TaxID=29552 RepID=A0A449BCA4_HAPAX|nr:recombination mediator RecR [Haploplasma axanthum]VEU80062.1 Recombination protein [Haploplasma axanthum]
MYPKALKDLMDNLEKLPSIGEKTAERLALYIISELDREDANLMADSIKNAIDSIRPCKISNILTDQEISPIVLDETRDHTTIMVVADSKDVFMMEKMGTYHGDYHVLGGLIDFSRGITDNDLNIESLTKRINSDLKELIIATNGTVEGELTAQYLKSLYEEKQIKVTRLAYGLPVGTDLRYADVLTLIKAVENRQEY